MTTRRLFAYGGVVITGACALIGFAVFVVGILIEFFNTRQQIEPTAGLSPIVQISLAGLCIAALMFGLWFTLVALLIARQMRRSGSGYADAYRLIEAFRFGDAIPLLERSIREGKETPDVLMLLTSAYAFSGQLAKAQATADRAVQLYPNDPSAYLTLANGYRLQAAYDGAAVALRTALEHAPDQPIIWAELGFVLYLAGDQDAALEAFKQAEDHSMPEMYEVRVHYHLARFYQASGDTQHAAKAVARMVRAREGLEVWKASLNALQGTAYGSALRYEVAAIEQALAEAAAAAENLG